MLRFLANQIATSRSPDVVIGGSERPYLRRWWVIPRNRFFNVYLHQFLRSDDDRALHDHPWINLSILIDGEYTEHTIAKGGVHYRVIRKTGAISGLKARMPAAAHRVELHAGPVWTLFITGPNVRSWGFHCPKGWVHWRDFTNPSDNGATVGRGCGEDA